MYAYIGDDVLHAHTLRETYEICKWCILHNTISPTNNHHPPPAIRIHISHIYSITYLSSLLFCIAVSEVPRHAMQCSL